MTQNKSPHIITLNLLIAILVQLAAQASMSTSAVNAQAENRAGLVVQFSDGSTRTYCFSFPGDTITGLELLQKAGLPMKIEGQGTMGALICKLGPDGCDYPGEPCVCKSYGPDGVYWSYHHLRDGRWRSSVQGASSYRVKPGEVDGWAWSDGSPPPVFTFEQLCAAGPAQPATSTAAHAPPSPTPINTRPPATATIGPFTHTPRPLPTRTPTTPRPQVTPTRTRTPQPVLLTRTPTLTPQPAAGSTQPSTGAAWLAAGAVRAAEAALPRGSRVE